MIATARAGASFIPASLEGALFRQRGGAADGEIASRLGYFGGSGLKIDLGLLSVDWLIAQNASGYMPRSMIGAHLADGRLGLIEGTPVGANPAYACWRVDSDQALIGDLVTLARSLAQR